MVISMTISWASIFFRPSTALAHSVTIVISESLVRDITIIVIHRSITAITNMEITQGLEKPANSCIYLELNNANGARYTKLQH